MEVNGEGVDEENGRELRLGFILEGADNRCETVCVRVLFDAERS